MKNVITWWIIFSIDIQDYFEYIIKKHETVTDKICVNKIENRILFKIKTGYYLEPFTLEAMNFFGSTTSKITKDENVPL